MALATEVGLPQDVLQLLPGDDISIANFLAWSLPPCAPINARFTRVLKSFYHHLPPMSRVLMISFPSIVLLTALSTFLLKKFGIHLRILSNLSNALT